MKYQSIIIEKKSMEDKNWDFVLPELEKKQDVRNINFSKEANKVTYEKITELVFEAESEEDAKRIVNNKTSVLCGFSSFYIESINEIKDLNQKQQEKMSAQNTIRSLTLNCADAENFLYEMDAAKTNEIWIGNQKITRSDCLKSLDLLK